MKKNLKIVLSGIALILLTACGGASSSSNSSTSSMPTENYGGTPDKPTPISLSIKNIISDNTAYNYFQYTGIENTKLFIHTTLDRELTRAETNRAYINQDSLIKIYDLNLNELPAMTYNKDLIYELPYDGTVIIKFDYPMGGYAVVSEVKP